MTKRGWIRNKIEKGNVCQAEKRAKWLLGVWMFRYEENSIKETLVSYVVRRFSSSVNLHGRVPEYYVAAA